MSINNTQIDFAKQHMHAYRIGNLSVKAEKKFYSQLKFSDVSYKGWRFAPSR